MPYQLPCPVGDMDATQLAEYLSVFGVKDTRYCKRQYLYQVLAKKGIKADVKPARFKVTITNANSEVVASHDPSNE